MTSVFGCWCSMTKTESVYEKCNDLFDVVRHDPALSWGKANTIRGEMQSCLLNNGPHLT